MLIGSLFSGIGGMDLGLERAGLGTTIWQVEADPFCRAVLATHWPDAQRFNDVRAVDASVLPPIDLLCGGFPCQDLSSAGKRAGLEGERSGLYREFLRIIDETAPRWVVIENVAHTWRRWVPVLRRELGARGFASLPIRIEACEVGARHERSRVFIVASDAARIGRLATVESSGEGQHREGRRSQARRCAAANVDDRRQLQPQGRVGELGGRADHGAPTDSHGQGLAVRQRVGGHPQPTPGAPAERDPGAISPGFGLPPRPWMVRGVHGLPAGVDLAGWPARWTPARARQARVAGLGNSCVPAQVEPVGRLIAAVEAQLPELARGAA